MSNGDASVEAFQERGATPYQARFAAQFVAADAPRRQLLVSPVGTGKTRIVRYIVSEMLAAGLARRILVLVPETVLAEQYEYVLAVQEQVGQAQIISRAAFRELQAAVPVGSDPWPEVIVAIVSMRTARDIFIAETLSQGHWDVVIIDEAHRVDSQLFRLLESMAQSGAKILALSAIDPAGAPNAHILFTDFAVTRWSLDSAELARSTPRPRVTRRFIEYKRGKDEAQFLRTLDHAVNHLLSITGSEETLEYVSALREHASSSISMVESSLYRGLGVFSWRDSVVANLLITDLLREIDSIESDQKVAALQEQLVTLASDGGTSSALVCVVSGFFSTIMYLREVLLESHAPSVLYPGQTQSERVRSISAFAQGGLLLTTDEDLRSLPTPDSQRVRVIHYDLPEFIDDGYNPGHSYSAFGGGAEQFDVLAFAFHDRSGVAVWEDSALALFREGV